MAETRERTQDEVVARYEAVREDDVFGFKADVLIPHLDIGHVETVYRPQVRVEEAGIFGELRTPGEPEPLDLENWVPEPLHLEAVMYELTGYMAFAWGKVRDHRGISAGRSVAKIEEYVWLLGRDDLLAAMEAAEYEQYGAPKLAVVCRALDLTIPESEALANMIGGRYCRPDCEEGCGL